MAHIEELNDGIREREQPDGLLAPISFCHCGTDTVLCSERRAKYPTPIPFSHAVLKLKTSKVSDQVDSQLPCIPQIDAWEYKGSGWSTLLVLRACMLGTVREVRIKAHTSHYATVQAVQVSSTFASQPQHSKDMSTSFYFVYSVTI